MCCAALKCENIIRSVKHNLLLFKFTVLMKFKLETSNILKVLRSFPECKWKRNVSIILMFSFYLPTIVAIKKRRSSHCTGKGERRPVVIGRVRNKRKRIPEAPAVNYHVFQVFPFKSRPAKGRRGFVISWTPISLLLVMTWCRAYVNVGRELSGGYRTNYVNERFLYLNINGHNVRLYVVAFGRHGISLAFQTDTPESSRCVAFDVWRKNSVRVCCSTRIDQGSLCTRREHEYGTRLE